MDSEPQTKVIGGNPHIAKSLSIQSTPGWTDQLCDQYLDGYRLIKKLGQGGMGSVYMAEQMSLRRMVALKMLNPLLARNRNFLERFISEAKAAAQVNHRNLVQIFDVGESNGVYYFSMEYVDGENAGQVLDRMGVLPWEISLDVIIPIVSSLSAAHGSGIIHRDVKPDNIMIDTTGIPKLADLGIAKVEGVAAMPDSRRTESGAQLGTPHYVSPEQARNPTDVDGRADVYSMGATLFHMVTGRPPYEGNNPAVILRKLATEPVPIASELNDQVPYSLSNVISRMMAKMPHERYSGPEELYQVLVDLRNQQQSKVTTGTQRVLSEGQQMRIEAPTDEAPVELYLEGEDPNDDSALYQNYQPKVARPGRPTGGPTAAAVADPDEYVPTVTRPKGPRPDSASLQAIGSSTGPMRPMARPPRPGSEEAQAKQPPMNVIIGGAVGLIFLVLVGGFLLIGPSDNGGDDSGGDTEIVKTSDDGTTGTPPPTTSSSTPVLTAAERRERNARELYGKWETKSPATCTEEELAEMAKVVAEIIEKYPRTDTAGEVKFLEPQIRKAQEKFQYDHLAAEVNKHLEGKDYAKALATLDGFIEKMGKKHSKAAAVEGDREKALEAAKDEYTRLIEALEALLEKHLYDKAKKTLEEARPKQVATYQGEVDKQLQRVAEAKLLHQRLIELERYPPYWKGVHAAMTAKPKGGRAPGLLDAAIAQAKATFKGPLLAVHPADVELADLKAVKAGRDAAIAALNAAHAKGKELTLSFVKRGKEETKTGKLRQPVDPEKQVVSMTTTYKRFYELSTKSLTELGGEHFAGPAGQLTLAIYLSAIGRDAEALKALEAGKSADPDRYRRYLLRFLGVRILRTASLADAQNPSPATRARIMAEAYRLGEFGEGSPYEGGLKAMGEKWIKANIGFIRSRELMRIISEEQGKGNIATCRALCKIVIKYRTHRRDAGFRQQAQATLDSLPK